MENSDNTINAIGKNTINPKASYIPSTVLSIFGIKRPTLSKWLKNGRLSQPTYPYGRTNGKSYHYWTGQQLLDCISGKTWKEHHKI